MTFDIERNRAGFWTLVETALGREKMHPLGDPSREGLELYVRPTRIAQRLAENAEPLVVWDVGLGMGANALACVREARHAQAPRELRIFSFENQVEGFRAVVAEQDRFPHAADPAARNLCETAQHRETGLEWILLEGDYFDRSKEAPAPDVIFFDPFSRNTNPRFWEMATFRELFHRCTNKRAVLSTYANARAIRNAMTEAGWKVAVGPGFGNRDQTTLAVTPLEAEASTEYAWLAAL